MDIQAEIAQHARTLIRDACAARARIVVAESCTGGLIAGALTAVAGASDAIEGGFVTYSNRMKHDLLGVDMGLINQHGAVSPEVAAAMAVGALQQAPNAQLSLSVTGVAGPGQSENKPAGLVYMGLCHRGKPPSTLRFYFEEKNRDQVRMHSVFEGVKALMLLVENTPS
ncbi:MAG: CinA family protein [Alphaproteobacteria bacterium]